MRHSLSPSNLSTLTILLLGCGIDSSHDLNENSIAQLAGAETAQLAPSAKHCVMVIDKLQPGEDESRVLSYECESGDRHLSQGVSGTLLMTWYEDDHYNGDNTDIRNSGGPCDASGYGISNVGSDWNDTISSFKVFNYCNYVTSYLNDNYGGFPPQSWNKPGVREYEVPYVGDAMNDKITSFRIRRR